jgi:hypothetical protein
VGRNMAMEKTQKKSMVRENISIAKREQMRMKCGVVKKVESDKIPKGTVIALSKGKNATRKIGQWQC